MTLSPPPDSDETDPFRNAGSRPLVSEPETDTRLRLALDAGRMALWSVDAEGNVQVSPEFNRLLRLPEDHQPTLEELLGRYAPGEVERVQAIVQQLNDVGFKVNRHPGEGLTAWFISFGQAF